MDCISNLVSVEKNNIINALNMSLLANIVCYNNVSINLVMANIVYNNIIKFSL